MYELKKNGKVFTGKFVGTGPSSYEKKNHQAAVSQRLRNTCLGEDGGIWKKQSHLVDWIQLAVFAGLWRSCEHFGCTEGWEFLVWLNDSLPRQKHVPCPASFFAPAYDQCSSVDLIRARDPAVRWTDHMTLLFIISDTDLDKPLDELHEGLQHGHVAHLLYNKNCERGLVPGEPLACWILYRPANTQHVVRNPNNLL